MKKNLLESGRNSELTSHMNYLYFGFSGPKYVRNNSFLVGFLADFLKYEKKFLTLNICTKFRISVITYSKRIMSLVFFELFEEN